MTANSQVASRADAGRPSYYVSISFRLGQEENLLGGKTNTNMSTWRATGHAYRISNARLLLAARWQTDGQVALGRERRRQQKSNGSFQKPSLGKRRFTGLKLPDRLRRESSSSWQRTNKDDLGRRKHFEPVETETRGRPSLSM